jgi:hypothetical protein
METGTRKIWRMSLSLSLNREQGSIIHSNSGSRRRSNIQISVTRSEKMTRRKLSSDGSGTICLTRAISNTYLQQRQQQHTHTHNPNHLTSFSYSPPNFFFKVDLNCEKKVFCKTISMSNGNHSPDPKTKNATTGHREERSLWELLRGVRGKQIE